MSQPNFNSIINFIDEFFSEVPPQALAIIISIITLTLYIAGGAVIATIVGFLALGITHSGPTVLIICILIVAIASIYGLIKAVKTYRIITLSYENKNSKTV